MDSNVAHSYQTVNKAFAVERSGHWNKQKAESREARRYQCVGSQGAVTQASSWPSETGNPDTESWVRGGRDLQCQEEEQSCYL